VGARLDNVTLAANDTVAVLVRPATGTSAAINGASLANGGGF
jgi:hypothetical protein